jgi:uncharacterized Zn finger protein (UPF0148 family)
MLKIYCTECGAPTEYSLNKPKFCSSCGNPFSGAKKQEEKVVQKVLLQKPTITAKRENIEPQDYEDDDAEVSEVNEVPNIDNLDFDINLITPTSEKIGNIVGSSERNDLRRNRSSEKVDRKKVLEDFAKEGGAIRPASRTVTNSSKSRKGRRNG